MAKSLKAKLSSLSLAYFQFSHSTIHSAMGLKYEPKVIVENE